MRTSSGSMGLLIGVVGITIAGIAAMSLTNFQSQEESALPVYDHLGQDFSLQSTHEPMNSMASAKGKVVLMSFGFTSCPDICPLMLEKYKRVYDALEEESSDSVVMYFVTVDPERDTVPVMKEHFASFDPRIIGLTGSKEAINELQTSLALASQEIPGTPLVSHSDRIMLFDTEGRLRAMPNLKDPVAELVIMVKDLLP